MPEKWGRHLQRKCINIARHHKILLFGEHKQQRSGVETVAVQIKWKYYYLGIFYNKIIVLFIHSTTLVSGRILADVGEM